MSSRRVVVVAYPDIELVDVACVTSAFSTANLIGANPDYDIVLASRAGGEVRCDSALVLVAQARLADVSGPIDTLVISGGLGHEAAAEDRQLLQQIRELATRSRRVASVCTGATVLAATGLLHGRRATTHWRYARQFADRYPTVQVDPQPIFIRDGNLATSGGVTAALDLTLAFIEEDHGAELARRVALGMVTYLQRPGTQPQLSLFTHASQPDDAVVRKALDHVTVHVDDDLTTAMLAEHVGVSVRQLTRLFRKHAGVSPAKAIQRIRLEVVAELLTSTDLRLSQVARRAGYSSTETMRQAFVRQYGVAPTTFRTMSADTGTNRTSTG